MMTVSRHKTATMPAFWFCFPTVPAATTAKTISCARTRRRREALSSPMYAPARGFSFKLSNLLICTAILSYRRALLHIRFLWCRLSAACFTHSLCTAHTHARSLSAPGDFLLTPYPSRSSWNLTLATGW